MESYPLPDTRWKVLVTRSCSTLCNPIDCCPPGSSVHGILQARILEWVAIPFSRVSSQPRDQTQVSHIAGRFFTTWATKEAQIWGRLLHLSPSTCKKEAHHSSGFLIICLQTILHWGTLLQSIYRVIWKAASFGVEPRAREGFVACPVFSKSSLAAWVIHSSRSHGRSTSWRKDAMWVLGQVPVGGSQCRPLRFSKRCHDTCCRE